jgi:hypothetical protein
MKAAGT